MKAIDFKQLSKELYAPKAGVVTEVTVPAMQFLMGDGQGDPNGPEFQTAVEALYSLAYTLKFWSKKHPAPAGWAEFSVAPLEGLWHVPGVNAPFAMNAPREDWHWTAMIRQPEFVTPELVAAAKAELAIKKPDLVTNKLRLAEFSEGRSVQIMHIGPYTQELPNIQKLDTYMAEHGLVSNGKHHEIYLGDPRRTAPDKLKTVLRHPVRAAQ